MNRLTLFLAIAVTALITFIATAVLADGNYEGYDAQHWYENYQSTETAREADWEAITCVRGLGYTNLPGLEDYYSNLGSIDSIDPAGNYYSKGQVDQCLYGL